MCALFSQEDVDSRYLEELGKREGSLPPEYVKLLKVSELKNTLFVCVFCHIGCFCFPFTAKLILILEQGIWQRCGPTKRK